MKVWSEREPGGYTECTESAYLLTMKYGGYDFGAATYTDAERDALDEAIGFDRVGGGNTFDDVDYGAMARYGSALRSIAGESRAAFRARLNKPGRAIALAGSLGGLPKGHYLRRWQPNFVGGHAWTVVPLGGGAVMWYDPLAVDDFEGDKATVDDVMKCAWSPSYAREALAGELIQEDDMTDFSIAKHENPKVVRIREGATIYLHDTGKAAMGEVLPGNSFDADMTGLIVNGRYLMRRLDRQHGGWWVTPDAIVPDAEIPYRRYTLDDGSVAIVDDLRTRIANAKTALG